MQKLQASHPCAVLFITTFLITSCWSDKKNKHLNQLSRLRSEAGHRFVFHTHPHCTLLTLCEEIEKKTTGHLLLVYLIFLFNFFSFISRIMTSDHPDKKLFFQIILMFLFSPLEKICLKRKFCFRIIFLSYFCFFNLFKHVKRKSC